ncbi:unnamed protein product [Sphenostylis stenocarpa]|uniref:Uncharacterized protein n=1 Tax=Sphenostylis stenocarpa TaxID=92480 RepID=A0AA86SN79_9FABA|nr:unnamed protein product [Sphenostylis stenocarpa]
MKVGKECPEIFHRSASQLPLRTTSAFLKPKRDSSEVKITFSPFHFSISFSLRNSDYAFALRAGMNVPRILENPRTAPVTAISKPFKPYQPIKKSLTPLCRVNSLIDAAPTGNDKFSEKTKEMVSLRCLEMSRIQMS